MSLINDALKRAKRSQQQRPPESPATPPLPPLTAPVQSEPHSNAGWIFLVILLISIACFFVGMAIATRKPVMETTVVTNIVQVAAAPVAPKIIPLQTNTAPAPAPPSPPPSPLRLEGIFYNASAPQAIVNGQTVYAGDNVDGFHIKKISKDTVSLIAPDGTEKTLALGK